MSHGKRAVSHWSQAIHFKASQPWLQWSWNRTPWAPRRSGLQRTTSSHKRRSNQQAKHNSSTRTTRTKATSHERQPQEAQHSTAHTPNQCRRNEVNSAAQKRPLVCPLRTVVASAGLLVGELAVGLHGLEGLQPLCAVDGTAHHCANPHNLLHEKAAAQVKRPTTQGRAASEWQASNSKNNAARGRTLARAEPDIFNVRKGLV